MRVTRTEGVHLALVGFALALVARSGWVQLRERAHWRAEARDQQTVSRVIPAARGRILDAAGTVLVDSRELVRLDVAPREVRDREALAAALRRLGVADAFVQRATDLARRWVELPGQHLATDVADLLAMRGVHRRRVIERVPPATVGLRNLLGIVDREGRAVGGVEAALDGALRGRDGRAVFVRAGRDGPVTSPEELVEPPVPGRTVVLTLHQGLQDIAERALGDAITALGARGGDVVVLDPRDGAIRALASRRARADATVATAFTEPYEPGSTLKPFVAAALLERGLARIEESMPTYGGTFELHGRTISDVHKAPSLTFAEVMRYSSNIGIVQFAQRLTHREQYAVLRDAGFGMVTGVPYPSESPGRLPPVRRWSAQSPASLAMGYEIAVTPLQLALAYGAIANGGELLEPQLVREIRDADGRVAFRGTRRVVRRLMSESTARTMRGLLREVVEDGTATAADLTVYSLGGKSGTARRIRDDGRGYEEGAYTASFVGLFPAESPQLVILVKLDAPRGDYGGVTAAPVTKAVLAAAIASRDAALDPSALRGPSPAAVTVAPSGSTSAPPPSASGSGAAIAPAPASVTVPGVVATPGATPLVDPPVRPPVTFDLARPSRPEGVVDALRAVPDVGGLPVRAAVRTLHAAGFRVALVGGEAGSSTSPAAGTLLPAGALIRLPTVR